MKRKAHDPKYESEIALLTACLSYASAHHGEEITLSESRRIAIFLEALQTGAGITSVQEALRAEDLRLLYVRDPYELILYYCFYHNEHARDQKYTFSTFAALLKELDLEGFVAHDALTRQEKDKRPSASRNPNLKSNEAQKTVTLGDLARFISLSPNEAEPTEQPLLIATREKTMQMRREFVRLMEKGPDAQSIRSYIEAHRQDYVGTSNSVRFYFCKYVFLIICHQILELKELLLQFSEGTPEAFIEKRALLDRNYTWSISATVEERIVNPEGYGVQASKVLLSAALVRFLLRGSSVSEKCIKILSPDEPLSCIRNKTLIFAPQSKSSSESNLRRHKVHMQFKQMIADLTIEDFYDYSINLSKVYDLLFDEIFLKSPAQSEEEEDKIRELNQKKRKYICQIIDGEYDMTRSALIMFLASSKCLLYNVDSFTKIRPDIFDDRAVLSVDRVNNILERCGYLHLLDDIETKYAAVDNYYYTLFEADSSDLSVYEQLRTILLEFSDAGQFNPFDFERSEVSSAEKRDLILKGIHHEHLH